MSRIKKFLFGLVVVVLVFVIGFLGYVAYQTNMPNELVVAIVVFAVLLSTLLIWYVPKFLIHKLPSEAGADYDHKSARLNLENSTRMTIAQIVGGMVLLGGVVFTFNGFRLQQEGQFTDRFTTAVTQVADDKLEIRLGGLYALERISKDSEKDYSTVMEVLSAFVRERSKRKDADKSIPANANKIANKVSAANTADVEYKDPERLATDIQAALTVIGRRKVVKSVLDEEVDLSYSDLSGAKLVWANLRGVNFNGANLQGASFFMSDLTDVKLWDTDLKDADLGEANLAGVNLQWTRNLTFEQLAKTFINENTELPKELESRKAELLELSRKSFASQMWPAEK